MDVFILVFILVILLVIGVLVVYVVGLSVIVGVFWIDLFLEVVMI